MERQYYDNREIEIDLIDLCKVFLANIKWIILAAVIGLAAALGYVAAKPVPAAITASQKKEELQKTLSADEIEYVENLYSTNTALNQTISNIQRQMSYLDVKNDDFNLDDCVMKTAGYLVKSDVFGVSEVFTTYLLGNEEYVNISQILYGSNDDVEKAFRRVSIWLTNDTRVFWEGAGDLEKETYPEQILNVRVISDSDIKADRVIQFVENCISRKQAELEKNGVTFSVTKLDEQTTQMEDVILSSIYSRTDSLAKDLYNIENQVSSLKNNYISKLTGDSKTYYDILSGSYKAEAAGSKNYKKYGLLGLLLGLFAALGWICVKYVLSNTVKTASELAWVMKGDLPYDLSADGKKKAPGDAAKLAAEDLLIKEAKNDIKKLYVITDGDTENNADLQVVISGLKAGVPVTCGNPLASAEALRELSEADGAVITAALKQRRRSDIAQIEQYCRNSGAKILGVIAL